MFPFESTKCLEKMFIFCANLWVGWSAFPKNGVWWLNHDSKLPFFTKSSVCSLVVIVSSGDPRKWMCHLRVFVKQCSRGKYVYIVVTFWMDKQARITLKVNYVDIEVSFFFKAKAMHLLNSCIFAAEKYNVLVLIYIIFYNYVSCVLLNPTTYFSA